VTAYAHLPNLNPKIGIARGEHLVGTATDASSVLKKRPDYQRRSRLGRVYPLLANRADVGDRNDCGLGGLCPRSVIVGGSRHPADEATRVDRDRLGGIEAGAAVAPPDPGQHDA